MLDETSRPNILIVDDEPKVCMLLKTFLERTGRFGNIITADSVSMAHLKARNQHFDIVIIDFHLPNKKGTAFIETTLNSYSSKKPKFILMSGFLDSNSVAKAMRIGVKRILVKPFSRAKLIDMISEILDSTK